MRYPMPAEAKAYVAAHQEELLELIETITKIPAPSNREQARAAFCKQWLENMGAEGVYIDEALNVVYPYRCDGKPLVVFMAHTDTVFSDSEISVRREGSRLYAPGIGDDTANLAVLLLAARYVTQQKLSSPYGILFVADSGEEGQGNLKGCRRIFHDYGTRVHEFISLDGGMGHYTILPIGSQRYRVTAKTKGGHSFHAFGSRNAIEVLASMVTQLYGIQVPTAGKTTYNVGMISGGTSVNTIAEEASMLYEFRSESEACLAEMQEKFLAIVAAHQTEDAQIRVETIGVRPCMGQVDRVRQQALWDRCTCILSSHWNGEITPESGSTDANIPWAIGIPSTTVGCVVTGGAHTYGEWIDADQMPACMSFGLNLVLSYFELP